MKHTKQHFYLSEDTAYKAMYEFLRDQYLQINKHEVLGDLLSDMGPTPDAHKTRDPAMWSEWIKVLEKAKISNEKSQR